MGTQLPMDRYKANLDGVEINPPDAPRLGTEKYGSEGLLASSVDRGWNGLAAMLFRHSGGDLPWKNTQPHTELCVDLVGNHSVVTRRGGGIVDRTVAKRGTVWMSPAGLSEDMLSISDAMPSVLHIYLPANHFSPESLGVDIDASAASSLRFERSIQDPLLAEISYAIASELRSETSTGRMLIETLACSLSARLLQHYIGQFPVRDSLSDLKQGLDGRRLSRVMEYIEANLEGSLTLDELASIACLSRFHFARSFKAAVGRPPHAYVSARRLEHAKDLLRRGDRPLIDIAMSLNFSTQANFSRAFRQLTGQAPGQFRRNAA